MPRAPAHYFMSTEPVASPLLRRNRPGGVMGRGGGGTEAGSFPRLSLGTCGRDGNSPQLVRSILRPERLAGRGRSSPISLISRYSDSSQMPGSKKPLGQCSVNSKEGKSKSRKEVPSMRLLEAPCFAPNLSYASTVAGVSPWYHPSGGPSPRPDLRGGT